MNNLISPEYKKLNSQMHHQMPKYGVSAQRYLSDIEDWLGELKPKTVLDYGCGKGGLKKGLRNKGIEVHEYDPCILGKGDFPGPAEVVFCIDVLEHVEPEYMDNVLDHIHALALKGLYITVSTTQGKRRLPDGRPAHISVYSFEFWKQKLFTVFGEGFAKKVDRKRTTDGLFKWEFNR